MESNWFGYCFNKINRQCGHHCFRYSGCFVRLLEKRSAVSQGRVVSSWVNQACLASRYRLGRTSCRSSGHGCIGTESSQHQTAQFVFRCTQWVWYFDVSQSLQVLCNRLLLDSLDAFDGSCEEGVCYPVHQCQLSAWVGDFQVLNHVWCSVWRTHHRVYQYCWSLFQRTTCVENVHPCTLLVVPWYNAQYLSDGHYVHV